MKKEEKTIKTYEVCAMLQNVSYADKLNILQAAINIVEFQEALKKAQNK